MADDDPRDERLGRLLEVEPLDELARRRLVATAMRASAPPARGLAGQTRSRLVAAAAVVAIVVVGGLSYLALRGGGTTAPSAISARPSPGTPVDRSATEPATTGSDAAKASPQSGAGTSESAAADSTATNSTGVPRVIGDVGDLQVAANLARLRASTTDTTLSTGTPAGPANDGASLVTRLRARACAGELPDGTIVAIGTGRFGARDAIVVETSLPDGGTSLDAVVAHPCEVRPLD